MEQLPKKALLRVDEVADYLRVHETTVRRYIQIGELDGVRFGGCVRVKRDSVLKYFVRVGKEIN